MILFIDDERKKMESYVEEIEFSYDVKFSSNIEDALEYWRTNHENITLLILDIMIPGNECIENDLCQDGLRTGIYFYQRIRQDDTQVPILIFTNVPENSDNLKNEIRENDDRVFFLQKEDFLPFQLVEKINKILPINQFC